MKKFLSLVLVLAMTMSLVVVGASAEDFTDAEDIQYAEAIDVMSAIGVVSGYDDGTFNPQGGLTRGAAAKIICNLILGPTTASALNADTAPYSDVPTSNTFAGYISYCQKEGIISGYADGTFKPAAPLTGYAFMKMLLGALGYDADIEGYVGANWSINVAKQALAIDLDDGLVGEFNGSKSVNREEACLYAFNTLKADMVEYDSKTTVEVNGASVNVGNSDFDEVTNNTSSDGNISKDKVMQFAEKYFKDLKKVDSTSSDDFGRPATEWKYKSSSIGTYVDSAQLVTTATAGVSKADAYDLMGKDIYDDLEDVEDQYGTLDTTKGDSHIKVYLDGDEVTKYVTLDQIAKKNDTDDAYGTGRGILTEVYLDDDYGTDENENMITIVLITTYLVQATSDYNDNKEEVNVEFIEVNGTNGKANLRPDNFPNYIEQDDFDVEDVLEDDYLLVTFAEGEIQSVEKAELLEGEVDTYKFNDSVTIGGEKYKYNYICQDRKAATYPLGAKGEDFSIGDTAVLVLDSYGYIMYVDDADASGNFVYIEEFGTPSGLNKTAIASAYFTDGTSDEIEVDEVTPYDNSKVSTVSAIKNQPAGWYSYTTNSAGEYKLKDIRLKDAYSDSGNVDYGNKNEGVQIIENESVKFLAGASSTTNSWVAQNVRANEDTVFIVLDEDDDIEVYTGLTNAPDITLTTIKADDTETPDVNEAEFAHIGYIKDDGYATYVFVDLNGITKADIDESSSSDDYMFFLDTSSKLVKVSSDDNYFEVPAIYNGEVTTVKLDEGHDLTDKKGDPIYEGKLYNKIKTDSNEYVTGATQISNNKLDQLVYSGVDTAKTDKDYYIDYSKSTLTLGGESYILSSGATINLIVDGVDANKDLLKDDGADYEVYLNISGSTLDGYLSGYEYKYDVYAIRDDDRSEILDVVYVWVTSAKETGKVVNNQQNNTAFAITDAGLGLSQSNKIKVQDVTTEGTLPTGATISVSVYKQSNVDGAALIGTTKNATLDDANIVTNATVPADGSYYAVVTVKDSKDAVVSTFTTEPVYLQAPAQQ